MPYSSQTQQKLCYDVIATIADGDTTSNAVDVGGTSILAFITDANLDATTFTFLSSNTLAGTYFPLKDMGTGIALVSQTGTSAQYATLPADLTSVEYLKIVANTAQSGADTSITLVTRSLA
tara:strand:+ start:8474 stop:8836 length:363 start_codon:yes stop_codon:yes gene_type:complete